MSKPGVTSSLKAPFASTKKADEKSGTGGTGIEKSGLVWRDRYNLRDPVQWKEFVTIRMCFLTY